MRNPFTRTILLNEMPSDDNDCWGHKANLGLQKNEDHCPINRPILNLGVTYILTRDLAFCPTIITHDEKSNENWHTIALVVGLNLHSNIDYN